MKTLFNFTITLFCMTLLQSCYDNYSSNLASYNNVDELGFLQIGRVLEYVVDSTFYVEGGGAANRESQLFIKEEITDTATDVNGNLLYLAVISTKPDSNSDYLATKQFFYRIEDNEIIRQMDNAPVIVFKAPVFKGVEWNAVKYTNSDFVNVSDLKAVDKTWNSEIITDDYAYSPSIPINTTISTIPNSIDVQLCDITDGGTTDYTDRLYFYYIYAPDIGAVYKVEEAYVLRGSSRRGYKLEYRLISYE